MPVINFNEVTQSAARDSGTRRSADRSDVSGYIAHVLDFTSEYLKEVKGTKFLRAVASKGAVVLNVAEILHDGEITE